MTVIAFVCIAAAACGGDQSPRAPPGVRRTMRRSVEVEADATLAGIPVSNMHALEVVLHHVLRVHAGGNDPPFWH